LTGVHRDVDRVHPVPVDDSRHLAFAAQATRGPRAGNPACPGAQTHLFHGKDSSWKGGAYGLSRPGPASAKPGPIVADSHSVVIRANSSSIASEIGRASCRERVEAWDGGVSCNM